MCSSYCNEQLGYKEKQDKKREKTPRKERKNK